MTDQGGVVTNQPGVVTNPPSRWLVVLAFATIYIIWGSSYLAIHFAIQTLPPFLMTGMRFGSAGLILLAWAKLRGVAWPTRAQWRAAAIVGGILFLINNASIVWAEGHGVPSGIVAVLIATVPMWIVLLTWLKPGGGGTFPGGMVIGGLVLGFVGIVLLVSPDKIAFNLTGVIVVLIGAFAWAYGSLYAKSAPLPQSAALSTGMQLFCGGLFQFVVSLLTGELTHFEPAQVSAISVLAMIYLAIVSSIIAYSAFAWLMKVSTPAKVSTYAYVNPVIAVFLGWLLASEPLTTRTLLAAGIIITAVVMINVNGYKSKSDAGIRPAEVMEVTP